MYIGIEEAPQNIYTSSYPSFEIVYNEDDYKAIEHMFDESTHYIITFINNEAMKLIPKYTIKKFYGCSFLESKYTQL